MLTLQRFSGINNVLPTERLTPEPKTGITPLAEATNVDVGLDLELLRRAGYSEASAVCHKNVWQGAGFMLATASGGDLINAETQAVLYPSLGVSRVWYTNLPDGRTTFSNGLINGITDGTAATKWGVPLPAGVGATTEISGALHPGRYRYQLTHVRLSDGLEGGPTYAGAFDLAEGGIVWTGLPLLDGHKTNVYLTSHNDDTAYLAGSTTGSAFSFTAANDTLTLPCKTDQCYPMPAGILSAFWRGRTLVASGSLLLASRPQQWELFDPAKDFKQFSDDITLIQPVENGIYVGTGKELAFLAGTQFDQLAAKHTVIEGAVVLGSGVTVPGDQIKGGAAGPAMLCIAAGLITAGFDGGSVAPLTEGRYQTSAAEVAATFRTVNGIPQYLAIEQ